jgi:hypothetical protein
MTTPLRLYQGQPAATEAVLLTAATYSTPVTITSVIACNTTASAATFSLSILPAGASAGDTNRLFKAVSVPAAGVWDWSGEVALLAEESLSGINGTSGAITLTISGRGV